MNKMKILALETSGENCSIALIDEEKTISEFNLNIGTTHSENLLPMIDIVEKFSKVCIKDIDVFACSIGPGSFTGLRIGLATLKGMALSLNKKVIGVPTLVGLAYNVPYFDGIVCSVLDAKNDNVYAANFEFIDKIIMKGPYISDNVDLLIDTLKTFNKNILFVGDGANTYKERFIKEFGNRAKFMPVHLNVQLATSIAKAALDKANQNEFDNFDTITPMYLKKSQAERTTGIDA